MGDVILRRGGHGAGCAAPRAARRRRDAPPVASAAPASRGGHLHGLGAASSRARPLGRMTAIYDGNSVPARGGGPGGTAPSPTACRPSCPTTPRAFTRRAGRPAGARRPGRHQWRRQQAGDPRRGQGGAERRSAPCEFGERGHAARQAAGLRRRSARTRRRSSPSRATRCRPTSRSSMFVLPGDPQADRARRRPPQRDPGDSRRAAALTHAVRSPPAAACEAVPPRAVSRATAVATPVGVDRDPT